MDRGHGRPAGDDLRGLLDRAGTLVKEGLGDARRAVSRLRGQRTPSLERLAELVERYRVDLELDVHCPSSGRLAPCPPTRISPSTAAHRRP
ncbi:hypothetical protein GCM10009680_53950 [Streptomyces yatensis]|uniref:Transcriptional regulator n=1 Tax=Streptomyces yatensis TaxID=155177 RepID=A0ABP4UM41_9ACTN